MNCPEPVARILLQILYQAALTIRMAGWQGDARRCAEEANHIHNIPHLISDYSDERLSYYWDAERGSYVRWCELNGQRVPEDLHVANKQYLIDRAFKLKRETASFQFQDDELPQVMAGAGHPMNDKSLREVSLG